MLTCLCVSADSLLQQVFAVRFLGSMAVRCGDNQEVIYEAMRQVLAARAIHNIFRTTESHLMVTSSSLRYNLSHIYEPLQECHHWEQLRQLIELRQMKVVMLSEISSSIDRKYPNKCFSCHILVNVVSTLTVEYSTFLIVLYQRYGEKVSWYIHSAVCFLSNCFGLLALWKQFHSFNIVIIFQ